MSQRTGNGILTYISPDRGLRHDLTYDRTPSQVISTKLQSHLTTHSPQTAVVFRIATCALQSHLTTQCPQTEHKVAH